MSTKQPATGRRQIANLEDIPNVGPVDEIAKSLGVSRNTVFEYFRKAKSEG